jgi:hypothetical protein
MSKRPRALLVPILVTACDAGWGWLLSTFVRPWLLPQLSRNPLEAIQLFDQAIEPRLWISYAVVLAAQLMWVNLIVPSVRSQRALRLIWWLGCLIIVSVSLLVHQDLVIQEAPELLILAVQLGDLMLLYWLTTRLLTPLPQRRVIPGWW